MSIADFDAIEANSAITIEVTEAESYGVSITADDNAIDSVECIKQGKALKIGLKPGSYRNYTLRAKGSLPILRRLH